MSTELRLEIWRKWYPHDAEPTADEWKAVHSLYPVPAVQAIKRARIVASGTRDDGKRINHPTMEEVAAVSKYKSSIDHKREIAAYHESQQEQRAQAKRSEFLLNFGAGKKTVVLPNHQSGKTKVIAAYNKAVEKTLQRLKETDNATTTQRRSNVKKGNGSARGDIRSARNNKAKRNKRK